MGQTDTTKLQRHFGLLHATALNVTMVVGSGIFVTVPLMLKALPGPYALLGWIGAGLLMILDGLIWSELGAMLPGSGGTYLYLLEGYGPKRWGRLMAFLFMWQFMLSGPLELGSGLIAIAQFSTSLSPGFAELNKLWTYELDLGSHELSMVVDPSRLVALAIGATLLFLLYRRIAVAGRLTITFWLGILLVMVWILIDGLIHFRPTVAFDFSRDAAQLPDQFARNLGEVMRLAMFSYLGYYTICYIGDEVRDPGRTIPKAILFSSLLVFLLFVGMHLAMMGTVAWPGLETSNVAATFMGKLHGDWAVKLVTLLLIWSGLGSVFAGLLGYSRIPYGAARYGHFFSVLGKVHHYHAIPHVSLLLVGGITLFWTFFELSTVINALIVTRIIEQFVCQIIAVMILRRTQPERSRPYKIWLYPLPCILALAGWLFMYFTAPLFFIMLGLGMLLAGALVFVIWTRRTRQWPFA